MKLKCNLCNKTVTKSKKTLEKTVSELGVDLQDYVSIYCCNKCVKLRLRLRYSSLFDWYAISKIPNLPLWFIEKYKDKVNWVCISAYQKLPESFIEKYKGKVDWKCISAYQKLSEKFMKKYRSKLDWKRVLAYHQLSEQSIERLENVVYWDYVCQFQQLSPEFVIKHIDKITEDIFYNPKYESYPDSLKLLLKQKFNKF